MVTREQAEEFRFAITGGGLLGGVMPTGTDVVALCTTVIDTERDAALGAACRAAVKAHDDEYCGAFGIDAIAENIGHGTNYMPFVEGARILRAIAAHLRAEGGSDGL